MKRVSVTLTVAAVGLSLLAGAALAGTDSPAKKRKLGFFASLFGESQPRRRDRNQRTVFGKNWLSGGDDDIRIINGQDQQTARKSRRQRIADDGDPEGDPGFGMGNLTYVAVKQVPLGAAVLAEPRPENTEAAAIYDALSSRELEIRVLPETREAILEQYRSAGFRPLWQASGKPSARAESLLKTLAAAGEEGLEPQNYLPPVLQDFDAAIPVGDASAMARLDIGLTAMALRYAHDVSGGQFDPRRLSLYNDVTPAWVAAKQALKVLAYSPYPAEYLASLQPRLPAYASFKAELAERRKSGVPVPPEPITTGDVVKLGQSDERLPEVRARLAERGFTSDLAVGEDTTVLDKNLSDQLRAFQSSAGIKATGLLGNKTIAALNRVDKVDEVPRLLNNMERLRWLPKSLGARYVFVNPAAFEVRVMDRGEEVWRSKVIVGKPLTQTAVFDDEIETVVFNPSWGVPPSIIANEYLPKLRNDPGYLDRIGFKVTDARGRVVSSDSVDWWSYGSKVPYGIQQPPGHKNALGELKFLFPNAHNIYMHDTPNRELFDNEVRAFSHGCVRVQNPREFAEILLGWDREKVDENTDSRQSQSVKLPAKVPVHITYFTAWPDENGKVQYFNDIYGRDQAMENARSAFTLAQR